MKIRKCKFGWKAVHKWIGLILTIFLLLFCISGLILNHRSSVIAYSVSRGLLPAGYRIKNFNNAIVKGTLPLDGGRILAYGNAGLWLTDSLFSTATDFNAGLPSGIDSKNIRNVVRAATRRRPNCCLPNMNWRQTGTWPPRRCSPRWARYSA